MQQSYYKMKKYILVLLLLFISTLLAAQEKHVVEAKETLYGLSKKYKVTIDELKKANPQLNERAPQIGETLIIPGNGKTNKDNKPATATTQTTTTPEYIYITVEPKETLYGLSKKYKTTVDTIKKLNPKMDENGPKIGEVLKMPNNLKIAQSDVPAPPKQDPAPKQTTSSQASYEDGVNVVFFLPFHTEITGANGERDIATQFYSGAKLALDSLTNRGKKINVKLLDCGNKNKFREILSTYDFSDIHLIIGPLFKSNILTVTDKIKKIPIVSPFSSSDELDDYDNLILYDTKEQILAEKLVDEMFKKYSWEKIYVLYDDQHSQTATYFKSLTQGRKSNAEVILTKNPEDIKPEVNLVTQENSKIYSILVSDQDAFITKYLDVITKFENNQIQPISLYYSGLFDNKKYADKLLDFGLIYSDTKYVNEQGFNEQKTINAYKKKYCGLPDKYAIAGFDVTYDILNRIDNRGNLSNNAMKLEGKQLSNKYSFSRIKKNGAWANQGARIIQLLK